MMLHTNTSWPLFYKNVFLLFYKSPRIFFTRPRKNVPLTHKHTWEKKCKPGGFKVKTYWRERLWKQMKINITEMNWLLLCLRWSMCLHLLKGLTTSLIHSCTDPPSPCFIPLVIFLHFFLSAASFASSLTPYSSTTRHSPPLRPFTALLVWCWHQLHQNTVEEGDGRLEEGKGWVRDVDKVVEINKYKSLCLQWFVL